MDREYWGENVNPGEDDADYERRRDEENLKKMMEDAVNAGIDAATNGIDSDDEEVVDEDTENTLEELDEIIEEIGPPAVIEATAAYLFGMPRPFHRVARELQKLAPKIHKAAGAVEEGNQTRGITE